MNQIKVPAIILSIILIFSFTVSAQETNEEVRIIKINVTGNEKIDTGFIMNNIKTRENDIYNIDKTREDLKNIYKTGFFSDVQLDVQDTDKGKILTFIVIERPPIKGIYVTGNKNIKTGDIRDKLKVKTGTVLNIEKIKESIDEIKKHYLSKGYYAVRINYEIDYEETYEATLKFFIEEPEKAYVKDIDFTGNKIMKASVLRNYMKTKEKGILSWFTGSGILDEETLESDKKNIEAYYNDNGLIRAKTGSPTVKVSDDQKTIKITIPVEEGNIYTIGSIDFTGDIIFAREELFGKIRSKPGIVFRSTVFHGDLLRISDLYQDKGYAFCDVTPLTTIDDDTQKVNIVFNIVMGHEIYFNRINILANTKTRDKVIRRELTFAEGDRFSSSHIKRSKKFLKNTMFFKDTDFKIIKTEEPDKVNLDLAVEERPTGTLSIGVGYSTAEKIILSGGIAQDNFLGTGRRLSLQTSLSAYVTHFNLAYLEPYIFNKDINAGLNLFNYKRIMDTYDFKKQGGSLSLIRPLTTDREIRGSATYRLENTEVSSIDTLYASDYIKSQEGSKITSSVILGLSKNTIDDLMNPNEGVNASVSFELAGGPFGGDNYFYRAIASYGQYIPAGFWDSTFFMKGTAGTIQSYSGKTTPIYENFFVGGIYTIRGFRYGEAGPKDSYDTPVGGKHAFYFNTEWIFPLYKPAGLKGLLFYDAGGAFDNSKGFTFQENMKATAGAGIRWFSPMGPIRLEFGYNLFPVQGDRKSAFDFTIGTQY